MSKQAARQALEEVLFTFNAVLEAARDVGIEVLPQLVHPTKARGNLVGLIIDGKHIAPRGKGDT